MYACKQTEHPGEIFASEGSRSKGHHKLLKDGILFYMEPLLLKVCDCTGEASALVCIIEDMPSGDCLSIERGDAKHVV